MPFTPYTLGPLQYTAKSGGYVQGQSSIGTNGALGNNSLRVGPMYVEQSLAINAFFSEFTVAGDVPSLFAVALYADDGTGYPGALLSSPGSISTGTGNAGTVATGGTPGVYVVPIGSVLNLQPGIYWIGGCIQGVTVTQPTMRTAQYFNFLATGNATPGVGAGALGYTAAMAGAAPSPFPSWPQGAAGSIPRVGVRIN